MYTKSSEYYDLIYGDNKDYKGESEVVIRFIDKYNPGAKTLLDVGCGTGGHDKYLVQKYQVEGLGLEYVYDEKGLTGRGLHVGIK